LGIIVLILVVVLYFLWAYIVGFLAIVGACQVWRVYRAWQQKGNNAKF
jgi:hypothetical protein